MQEEEPGAVASAPVEEPTEAAALHIVLMPDCGGEDQLEPDCDGKGNQDKVSEMTSASRIRLWDAVHLARVNRGYQ
jgi:hypothetical protein